MTRKCAKCGQNTGPSRRVCKDCSLEDRYGTAVDEDDGRDRDDQLEYRCTGCGAEYRGERACPDCGARRRRFIGELAA